MINRNIVNLYDQIKFLFVVGLGCISSFIEAITYTTVFGFLEQFLSSDITKVSTPFKLAQFLPELNSTGILWLITLSTMLKMTSITLSNHFLFSLKAKLTYRLNQKLIARISTETISSSDAIKENVYDVDILLRQLFVPIYTISTGVIIVLTLATIAILNNPQLSALAWITIVILFIIVGYVANKKIYQLSEVRQKSEYKLFEYIEVVSVGKINFQLNLYKSQMLSSIFKVSKNVAFTQSSAASLADLPKIVIEFAGFMSLVVFLGAAATYADNINSDSLLLILAVTARCVPPMQRLSKAASQIIFGVGVYRKLSKRLSGRVDELDSTKLEVQEKELGRHLAKENLRIDTLSVKLGDAETIKFQELTLIPGLNLLVGPNGSGKSTLLKALVGCYPTETSKIRFDEAELNKIPSRAGIAFLSQFPVLINDTIANNMLNLYGLNPTTELLSRTAKLLEMSFLGNDICPETYIDIDKYSSGELQKIAVFLCLLADRSFIILDEALNALDDANVNSILELLSQKKTCMILVVHHGYNNDIIDANQVRLKL